MKHSRKSALYSWNSSHANSIKSPTHQYPQSSFTLQSPRKGCRTTYYRHITNNRNSNTIEMLKIYFKCHAMLRYVINHCRRVPSCLFNYILSKESASDLHATFNTFIKHNDFSFLPFQFFWYYNFLDVRQNEIMKKVCWEANFISGAKNGWKYN